MSITAMRIAQIHMRANALRAAVCLVLRYISYLMLALLLGVLNPALCLLHCYVGHNSHTIAQPPRHSQAQPGHHGPSAAADDGSVGHQDNETQVSTGQKACNDLVPRAAYELVPVLPALSMAIIAIIARALLPLWRAPYTTPFRPPTPPPQILTFI